MSISYRQLQKQETLTNEILEVKMWDDIIRTTNLSKNYKYDDLKSRLDQLGSRCQLGRCQLGRCQLGRCQLGRCQLARCQLTISARSA
jgi:hypothetical protein